MTDVQTSQAEATSESQLVLGTEDGRVLLLDRTGSAAVVDRLVAPSPAAILGSTGTLSGQPHVVYLSRAGHAIVLSGQGLQSQSSSVSLPAPPVSLVVLK